VCKFLTKRNIEKYFMKGKQKRSHENIIISFFGGRGKGKYWGLYCRSAWLIFEK
jgi:hypothetical protein